MSGGGEGGGLTHMLGVDMPFKPSNLDTTYLFQARKSNFLYSF